MLERIQVLTAEATAAIDAASSPEAIEALRAAWLGRSGKFQEVLRALGTLPASDRGPVGKSANEAKERLSALLDSKLAVLRDANEASLGDREWVDASMAVATTTGRRSGTIHPVSQLIRELEDTCLSMGFDVLDGPWVEDEYHNFEALNIPRDHPARDMQDTTWLEDGNLLRTHTSPVQIRAMETKKPPIRAVAIGRVFRHEALDASHENPFHQIEGLLVDHDVNVGH